MPTASTASNYTLHNSLLWILRASVPKTLSISIATDRANDETQLQSWNISDNTDTRYQFNSIAGCSYR